MNPVDFGVEQTAFLPPHDLVTLVMYARDQPEYLLLPVTRLEGTEGPVISRWSLTPEERTRIAAGEDLYIEVLTFHRPLQPILPTVGLHDFCPTDYVR